MAKFKTKWKIEIIVLELLIICALLAIIFVDNVESYSFNSDATYFLDGIDYIIPSGSIAKFDAKNNQIKIERNDDSDLIGNEIPVFYEDNNVLVLMSDFIYLRPEGGDIKATKLSYFTEIQNNGNYLTISRNTQSDEEIGGILFDGYDTYTLLQPMIIEYSDKVISLPAFSFVTVVKDNYIQYYDYELKSFVIDYFSNNIFMRDKNDTYTINLSSDIVSFTFSDVMLFSFIDSYEPYFEVTE